MMQSLYDVLLVDPSASLDDIKLAFKKRALQVHPDKGGSKEAFHLVYHALEILADPLSRQKYDMAVRTSGPGKKLGNHLPKRQAKAKSQAKAKAAAAPTKRSPPPRSAGETSEAPAARSENTILRKVRDFLKELPRDVRNEVISQHFSQKQRLLLEKWMVETTSSSQLETTASAPNLNSNESGSAPRDVSSSRHKNHRGASVKLRALALTTHPRQKLKDKKDSKQRVRGVNGFVERVRRESSNYRARIHIESVEMYTGQCDLPTALEYLVILTAVKHRMVEMEANIPFRLRFQQALMSCTQEQGRTQAELSLSFCLRQRVSVFFGRGYQVQSPRVRCINYLDQIQNCLNPFRSLSKIRWEKGSIFWWYSPAHLQEVWENYQLAISEAWAVAGKDSKDVLQKMRTLYHSDQGFHAKHLQIWELQHMAMQDQKLMKPSPGDRKRQSHLQRFERLEMAKEDKNRHRPRHLKTGDARMEGRERMRMAMHDMTKHQPKSLRGKITTESRAQEKVNKNVMALKKLLRRWGQILKKEARLLTKKHRAALRQRSKAASEKARAESLRRKRRREEERLMREWYRKRRQSDLNMGGQWDGNACGAK